MPRPIYLLCSQSYVIDQATNQMSFFNLIEELKIIKVPDNVSPGVICPFTLRVVSAWMMSEEDEPGQIFETEFVIKFPKESEPAEEVIFSRPTFSFTTVFHRLMSPDLAIQRFSGPGMMWVECRLRRAGETEWLTRQEYPVLLIDSGAGFPKVSQDGEKAAPNPIAQ